jgi:RNA recognition motif-containing protein
MKRQKNFAYVDFANENDLQDVLKTHPSGSIRESPITVEISNPPVRGVTERGGRGRRRAGRGGSSSSKDTPKGDATPKGDTPKND